MSYTFYLEIESGISKDELVSKVSSLTGSEAKDDILIYDNIWMRIYQPDDVNDSDFSYGVKPDICLLMRAQPVKENDMKYILSIVNRLLEDNSWNAILMDEQPMPVFVYKDKIFTWNKKWYEDLVNIIQCHMRKSINKIGEI